ncbi:MAG: phenylalanine--tRNA ligase subunit alpha [Ferruginibacter sp.]
MESLVNKIAQYKQEISQAELNSSDALENFRIHYLGTKGLVKTIMGEMKNVAAENKREAGQLLNEFKLYTESIFENAKNALDNTGSISKHDLDLSLPGTAMPMGSRHPISIVQNKIISIFNRLGFTVAEGPEIEDDWHNFTALNLPENHPARDMQDTFYVEAPENGGADWLLRTHTSSVQIREMEKGILPLRIICPGRVYRNETISARAHCFFHQVEGLYIADNVSFADLKQTLYFFVQEMFADAGAEVSIRFRPSYFPFTEPSAEMDISCLICKGKGCSVCKKTGWVEILGCGMVHPAVLENCKIDSNKNTGFAFGMGIERIAMLVYQIKDLRLFSENDIRFLNQFSSAL